MPKFLGCGPSPDAHDSPGERSPQTPTRTKSGELSPSTPPQQPNRLSAGLFMPDSTLASGVVIARRGVPASKESAGSFRNRAASSSKGLDDLGSRSRRGFSTKDSTSSLRSGGSSARTASSEGLGESVVARRQVRRRTGTGRSTSGSKTGGSRRRSRGTSRDGGAEESDDSEGLEDAQASVPDHLQDAIPLHMRGELLLKPGEKMPEGDNFSPQPSVPLTPTSSRTAPVDEYKPEEPPQEDVYCGPAWVKVQVGVFIAWVLLASSLLVVFILRFQGGLGNTMHMLAADAAIRALEVNASGVFSPAVSTVRAVALGASAGLFEVGDPYGALRTILTPEMKVAPGLLRAQVLGLAATRMVRVLPGRLHDETVVDPAARALLAYTLTTSGCQRATDQYACFRLNGTAGIDVALGPTEGASLAMAGPTFLEPGTQGESRHPREWEAVHHLLAYVNRTGAGGETSRANLYVDVAIDLAPVAAIARRAKPDYGDIVLTTASGLVLASSLPQPEEPDFVVNEDGTAFRPMHSLWELRLPWAGRVSPQALAATERTELQLGEDLVVVRPVQLGMRGQGLRAASAASLRAVVFVQRASAVRPLLVAISYASLAVLAAPFATALLLLAAYGVYVAARRCVASIFGTESSDSSSADD